VNGGASIPVIGEFKRILCVASRLFARFSHRLTARSWVLVCALVSVVRWVLMATSPPLWLLIVAQALHGITYALGFLACTRFIGNWTSEDIAAEAQGLFATLQTGMAVTMMADFGWFYAIWGDGAFWISALLAAAGALAAGASRRLQPPGTGPGALVAGA